MRDAVIETAGQRFSAFVPDLPGCIATGETPDAVATAIREAIRFQVEALSTDGESVPPPKLPDTPIAPEPERSDPEFVEHPFVTFTEWADPADDEDYGDL